MNEWKPCEQVDCEIDAWLWKGSCVKRPGITKTLK